MLFEEALSSGVYLRRDLIWRRVLECDAAGPPPRSESKAGEGGEAYAGGGGGRWRRLQCTLQSCRLDIDDTGAVTALLRRGCGADASAAAVAEVKSIVLPAKTVDVARFSKMVMPGAAPQEVAEVMKFVVGASTPVWFSNPALRPFLSETRVLLFGTEADAAATVRASPPRVNGLPAAAPCK